MTRGFIVRLARRLVPRSWRETVASDLAIEARTLGRGTFWIAWHTLLAAARLRSTTLGDLMWTDVRYAVRSLLRARWFTVAAVLTLALGIGANVAVLSVVDQMMFRPLPYAQPESLVQIHALRMSGPETYAGLTRGVTVALAANSQSFAGIAYASNGASPVAAPGELSLQLAHATANVLDVLGVRPVVGRSFAPEDAGTRPNPVLLAYDTWRVRFGGVEDLDSLAWGRGASSYRVIGVLPDGFLLPSSQFGTRFDGVLVRYDLAPGQQDARQMIAAPVARLRPGVSTAQAEAELEALRERLHADDPTNPMLGRAIAVQPLQQGMFMFVRPYLQLVTIGSGLVLLMAAGNLSMLLLLRARSRERQRAIHTALGASAARLTAGVVAEAALLSVAGGAVAVLLCLALERTLLAIVPPMLQAFVSSAVDVRILTATLVLAFLAALLSAVPVALQTRRLDVVSIIRGARAGAARRRLTGGAGLLIAEAAVGVALVTGAAVTVRNLAGLVLKHPGFVAADLYSVNVYHQDPVPPGTRASTVRGIVTALRQAPGIDAAGIFSRPPVGNWAVEDEFWEAQGLTGGVWGASDGALESLGARRIDGRLFSADDIDGERRVTVVSRSAAASLWPGAGIGGAVGQRVRVGASDYSVIGVIEDIRRYPGEGPMRALFLPVVSPDVRVSGSSAIAFVRGRPGAPPDWDAARAVLDRRFPPSRILPEPVANRIDPWFERPTFQATLFGSFAAIALALAAVGLHAATAFDVARRRREVGVRMTLGATRRDIGRLVLQRSIRPVLIGAAAGLVVTWWAARFLQVFLFEVDARDPWTLALVVVVLIATAIVAAWLPMRRAVRTDPALVLRAD